MTRFDNDYHTGDGYSCYSESNANTPIDEVPQPSCLMGVCWCPSGWEHKNGECLKQDGSTTEINDNRDRKFVFVSDTGMSLTSANLKISILPQTIYVYLIQCAHTQLEPIFERYTSLNI